MPDNIESFAEIFSELIVLWAVHSIPRGTEQVPISEKSLAAFVQSYSDVVIRDMVGRMLEGGYNRGELAAYLGMKGVEVIGFNSDTVLHEGEPGKVH